MKTLTITYRNRTIEIPYGLDLSPGYAGYPLLDIRDKNGHHHTFFRSVGLGWCPIGAPPNWPAEFLQVLYEAFEREYQALDNK